MTSPVTPFSLKDAPALIERLLPVQKLSAEAYKEQMAVHGKTLTALGSYWKGRKPLILAKACVLGCLLPATEDPARDLEIFEMLMAMDAESFAARWKRAIKPKNILAEVAVARITDYFTVSPEDALPVSAPVDWARPEYDNVRVVWRDDISPLDRRRLEAQALPPMSLTGNGWGRPDARKRCWTPSTTISGRRSTPIWGRRPFPPPNWWRSWASCALGAARRWPTPFAAPGKSPSKPRAWAAMYTPLI